MDAQTQIGNEIAREMDFLSFAYLGFEKAYRGKAISALFRDRKLAEQWVEIDPARREFQLIVTDLF